VGTFFPIPDRVPVAAIGISSRKFAGIGQLQRHD